MFYFGWFLITVGLLCGAVCTTQVIRSFFKSWNHVPANPWDFYDEPSIKVGYIVGLLLSGFLATGGVAALVFSYMS